MNKNYTPPYTITSKIPKLSFLISEELTKLQFTHAASKPTTKKKESYQNFSRYFRDRG